jgi:hypothetical protein
VDIAERQARSAQVQKLVRTTLVERDVDMVATTTQASLCEESVPLKRLPELAGWGGRLNQLRLFPLRRLAGRTIARDCPGW